jgi:glycosyltransferase involved in cell wall biosynthesis
VTQVPSQPIRVLELRSVRGTGGGPEKTIVNGAAQADRARYEITVCYIRDQRDDVFAVDRKATAAAVDYVEVLERHSFDRRIWRALRKLIQDRHIDIIHAHDYKTDVLTLPLAHVEGVIPLATAHGWAGLSLRERFLYYPIDRRALARFPAVVAVSEPIRRQIIAAGGAPDRVVTILNGIDHLVFRRDPAREAEARRAFGVESHDTVVGAVGRLEEVKRFDLLIQACAELQRHRPNLKLIIVGDGSLRDRLEAQAARDLLPGSWRMPGHVDDVLAVHHALDLLVQSSDSEGTPNALLEAMAIETPLVATLAGGTEGVVSDGIHGLLLAPGNAALLAATMERALADPTAARVRAQAARRRVEDELSFQHRMRKLEALYESLVAKYRPRTDGGRAWSWV